MRITDEENKKDTTLSVKHERLSEFHLAAQKKVAFILMPIVILYGLISAWLTPCWQAWTMVAASFLTSFACCLGYYLALRQKMKLENTALIFTLAVVGFEMVELCMIKGTELSIAFAFIAVLSYIALFSKNYVYVLGVAIGGVSVLSEFIKYTQPYEIQITQGADRFLGQTIFIVLLIYVTVVFLRQSQTINHLILEQLKKNNMGQSKIINAIGNVRPIIDDVTAEMEHLSVTLSSKARGQALSTTQLNSMAAVFKKNSANTANAADSARNITEEIREAAIHTANQIESVTKGVVELKDLSESSNEAMEKLVDRISDIELFLKYNRDIGGQLKILAVNAAIQAAKAGEFGEGFRRVAVEMKTMVKDTDENLGKSRKLLWDIRNMAQDTLKFTAREARLLDHHTEELHGTASMMGEISSGFIDASEQVEHIATQLREQDAVIDNVGMEIEQIDISASHLKSSSENLAVGIEKLSNARQALQEALIEKKQSLATESQ